MSPRSRGPRTRSWGARLVLASIALVALGADCLASSRPLVARLGGELHVLPNLTAPASFPADLDALDAAMSPGDWYVPALVPYGSNQSRIHGEVRAARPPSSAHWLGTDRAGCDVFARLVHGARASLSIGLLAALLAGVAGFALGLWAGARGRFVDAALSRLAEAFVAFPPLVLLCALQAMSSDRGHGGVFAVAFTLAVVGWPYYFRLVRGAVREARQEPYVLAAYALGASPLRIATRHLAPAAFAPALVALAFSVPSAILLEASLSYLGAGLPPSVPSWGELLDQAGLGWSRWWLVLFPGLALALTAGALLRLADELRAHLEPKGATLGR